MARAWIVWLAWFPLAATAEPAFQPGTQITFRGSVQQANRDRAPRPEPGKAFDLTLLVVNADDTATRLYWLVEERGQGAWPWLERFGRMSLDAQYQAVGPQGPALLYDYGEGQHVIPLLAPFLTIATPLALDAAWSDDGLDYEVEAAKEIDDRDTWQIAVKNGYGPKRTLWVDKQSPLLVRLTERVFMDKGTEYQLELKLVGTEPLADDVYQVTRRGFETLVALREKLKRPARSQAEELSAEHRQLLARQLPELEKSVTSGPLARLVRTANRELKTQSGRAEALAEHSARQIGRGIEPFSITGLGQDTLSAESLAGQVTVLHFWEYRDEPLQEPYGQVGYLEFLHNRRKSAGLKVVGVAVDGRLTNEASRKAAVASARKLKAFMNLTYPVLLDDGKLLRQFGDPRPLGAALPLFVVVGRDGKIAHYHVGYYAVDRENGLKELDAFVAELLDREPPAR